MRVSSKLLAVAGIIALVAVAALVKFRYGGNTAPVAVEPAVPESPPPAALETNSSAFFTHHTPTSTNEVSSAMTGAAADLTTNWPDKIDTILASDVPESDKTKQFLEMFPKLPEEGQEAVVNHLSNLLPNEEYGQLANLFTNAELSPEVLEVLLRDALNRPNSLKLPVLLEVARNPQHVKAAEARETLAFMLEEDDGDDWPKWQAKMNEWLQANPD